MGQSFQLQCRNLGPDSEEILRSALSRRLGERCCALGDSGFAVDICVEPGLKEGEYRITPGAGGVKIVVGDACAAFTGAWEFLSSSFFDGKGNFVPTRASICFAPERPIRGLYFATHFNNFYHIAPIERVREQVEDVALRGGNAIAVWYDMHHYQSIDEPASRQMIERLKEILRHARRIGMITCMTMLSNESYVSTPKRLRAQFKVQNGYHTIPDGNYGVEICPSQDGGIEEIVRLRREMFQAFSDVQPDYVIYWPYDQGGCTCEKCAPWGTNGFVRLMPHFYKVLQEVMPGTKMIVSTWYFDKFIPGEWAQFHELAEEGAVADAAYLMDFFPCGVVPKCIAERGLPGGKRMLAFPEISMYGGKPWGGFGANPYPAFLQKSNDAGMLFYSGQFCYSEGIFEDANKSIMLDACSGRRPNALDALRNYAKVEFCTEDVDDIVRLMEMLEQSLPRAEVLSKSGILYKIEDDSQVKDAELLVERIDARLSENARRNWRWRILYLRAKADAALAAAGGRVLAECDCYLDELDEIYFTHGQSASVVAPPTTRFIAKRCGG